MVSCPYNLLVLQTKNIRLCTVTPSAGGRVFERGDEDLLQLAHQKGSELVFGYSAEIQLLIQK